MKVLQYLLLAAFLYQTLAISRRLKHLLREDRHMEDLRRTLANLHRSERRSLYSRRGELSSEDGVESDSGPTEPEEDDGRSEEKRGRDGDYDDHAARQHRILRIRERRQEDKRSQTSERSGEEGSESRSDEEDRTSEEQIKDQERFVPRLHGGRKHELDDLNTLTDLELESADETEQDFLRPYYTDKRDSELELDRFSPQPQEDSSEEEGEEGEDIWRNIIEVMSRKDPHLASNSDEEWREEDLKSVLENFQKMSDVGLGGSSRFEASDESSQESGEEDEEDEGDEEDGGLSEMLERQEMGRNLEKMLIAENGRREVDVELRYSMDLDTSRNWQLDWDIIPATQTIIFRLKVRQINDGHGWLLFGFSDYGEATDADLVTFWTTKTGRHHWKDGHTDSNGVLHFDRHQDYTMEAAEVGLDHLVLVFSRAYDTCDDDDYIIDSGTTHMLFASGAGPLATLKDINVTSLPPGMQRAQLIQSQLPDAAMPDDNTEFVMHVNEVTIPAVETTYWCSVQELPPFNSKHHIVKFEGDISEASRGIVHHMEVFHCEIPPGEKPRDYNAPCKSMAERPRGLEPCRTVIGAWAMGAEALTYPQEAGYAIGGRDFSRYVMLEVHYNNPDMVGGIVDSSGIKFSVTSHLRKYDAGIMELGLEYTDKLALPPHLDLWTLTGYCIPECTSVALPGDGIRVFASQLHTHLTGKRVYTKHYRNGAELPELNRDNHYSPHYQSIRKLPRQVAVLPGDSLVTTCVDSTKDKTNITMGGFAISDEMCVNYIHYYPKVNLEVCKSSVTLKSLYGFFKFMQEYQEEPTSDELGISDNYKAIHWSRMNVELLRTYYEQAPLAMQCNQSDGDRFPGNWEGLSIPQVKLPLPPMERPCLQ